MTKDRCQGCEEEKDTTAYEMDDGVFINLCRQCVTKLPWTYTCIETDKSVVRNSCREIENYAKRHLAKCDKCRDLVDEDPREYARTLIHPEVTGERVMRNLKPHTVEELIEYLTVVMDTLNGVIGVVAPHRDPYGDEEGAERVVINAERQSLVVECLMYSNLEIDNVITHLNEMSHKINLGEEE